MGIKCTFKVSSKYQRKTFETGTLKGVYHEGKENLSNSEGIFKGKAP